MSQTRIYVELDKDEAIDLAEQVENAFEEDGFAVASFEVDINTNLWCVSAYVSHENAASAQETFKEVLAKSDYDLDVGIEKLPETNWVAETLRDLAPVRAARFVVHGSHDADIPKPHEYSICIDASLAFGTGHHGTTAGCLDVLDRVLKRRTFKNALDLGTGTGVLAIAIAKATNAKVIATDIDPVATYVTEQNCKLNGVTDRITAATAANLNHNLIRASKPYDLVVANILARPLQNMSADLASSVALGGCVILSGLLPHHQARIVATYRQYGLALVKAHIKEGWLTLELSKG